MTPPGGIVGVIPARGGSKRLPGKNHRLLCGKPLIAWTIEAALASHALDHVIVSSDDVRILHIAASYGVGFVERSADLSSDDAASIDVVIDALEHTERNGMDFRAVMLLQPTSPLRDSSDIKAATERFNEQSEQALVSMCEAECPPHWIATLDDEEKIHHFHPVSAGSTEKRLRLNGAIYLATSSHIRQNKSFYTDVTRVYRMPREASLDIDTETDFFICEYLLAKKLKVGIV